MSKLTIFKTDLQNRIGYLLREGKAPMEIASICECSDSVVYAIRDSHKFQRLMFDSAMSRLYSEGVPLAIDTLFDVAANKKNSAQARVSAADKILHYTGYDMTEQLKQEKTPENMTPAEIQQRLQELQNEAANRAKPAVIDAKPSNSVDNLL